MPKGNNDPYNSGAFSNLIDVHEKAVPTPPVDYYCGFFSNGQTPPYPNGIMILERSDGLWYVRGYLSRFRFDAVEAFNSCTGSTFGNVVATALIEDYYENRVL